MKAAEKLLEKYLQGNATVQEQELVEKWYAELQVPDTSGWDELQKKQQLDRIRLNLPGAKRPTPKLWPRILLAAAAIAVVVVMVVFFNSDKIKGPGAAFSGDIASGRPGATLTLSDGREIRLTDAANGEIASEAGLSVRKSANGELIYELKASGSPTGKPTGENILRTAKGETYMLILPDQTRVWMNAASSLTYAANLFTKGQRRVKLEGEAFFQVAEDKAHPFVLECGGQQIEVLGTQFNVNAYADEPVLKTTLLEGKVKVSTARQQKMLSPGQQASFSHGSLSVAAVNTEEAVSWKNGDIVLEGQDVQHIMRMVSRWYDVEVVYEGEIPKELYYAKISRSDNISILLKALEKAQGIHFKIEGRKIIVSN